MFWIMRLAEEEVPEAETLRLGLELLHDRYHGVPSRDGF